MKKFQDNNAFPQKEDRAGPYKRERSLRPTILGLIGFLITIISFFILYLGYNIRVEFIYFGMFVSFCAVVYGFALAFGERK